MTTPIRIKSSDRLGNIAYIHRDGNSGFRCTLADGLPASLSYAGIGSDEMACRFALEACVTGEQALEVVQRHGSPLHRYELVMPHSPEVKALYLRLYHGRRDPDAQLEDWGSEGPVIGPLAYVHTTYMCDVRFAAAPAVMERFFPSVIAEWRERGFSNASGPLCDWQFTVVDDLIEYDGVYYGDWTVFLASASEISDAAPPSDQA